MPQYKYKKIDAFTSGKSMGNPAACLYLEDGQNLSEEEMLFIAKQHKGFVSEVVYCTRKGKDIKLAYFSSECEVGFCGHGTVACLYDLIKNSPDLLNEKEIAIDTNNKGKLTVYNRVKENGAVFITAPEPVYIGTDINEERAARALGLNPECIIKDYPIDIIDAGLRTLIIPIKSIGTEISVFPDESELKKLCKENQIDIILIFSFEVKDTSNIAHTRVFAPKFGYLEDPATGSGNSAFAYYMLKNNLWDGSDCSVEQGGNDRVFNRIQLMLKDEKVLFGGGASVRIEGKFFL